MEAAASIIALVHSELEHLPSEAVFQAQWEAGVFFRKHSDWRRAAAQLESLSRGDPGAGIVKLELALVCYKGGDFRGAETYFDLALEMDASLFKPAAAVMHAEAVLRGGPRTPRPSPGSPRPRL